MSRGVNLSAIGIGSDARNLYEVQRWSATSGGVSIRSEDVADELHRAVARQEEDEGDGLLFNRETVRGPFSVGLG